LTDISNHDYKPHLVVLTDDCDKITKADFVKSVDIKNYNPEYLDYQTNYYDFDFSVKDIRLGAG